MVTNIGCEFAYTPDTTVTGVKRQWRSYFSGMTRALMSTPLAKLAATSRHILVALADRQEKLRPVRLGKLLVAAKFVSQEVVDKAIAMQAAGSHKKLGEILVEMGVVKETEIQAILDHKSGLIHVDLAKYPLNPEVIKCLPAPLVREHRILPFDRVNGKLCVAAEGDLLPQVRQLIAYRSESRSVQVFLPTDKQLLADLRERYYVRPESVVFGKEALDTRYSDADEPSLRLVVARAIAHKASDIHLYLLQDSCEVHFRVDGFLTKFDTMTAAQGAKVIRQLEVLAGIGFRKPKEAQEGRLSLTSDGHPVDLRISVIPNAKGVSLVMRVLDARKFPSNITELHLPTAHEAVLQSLVQRPHGLFLLAGPTGSGKTTTLYTMLKQLRAQGGRHIATAEDPVEFILPGINQFDTENFAQKLKQLLRHDPDVLMVGELRDVDSGLTAVNAALTGHLVLSTLHANDSISAVHRLLTLGVPPVLIGGSLQGVMSQRLIRLTCQACKGEGCAICSNTGYLGRKLISELIRPKPSFGEQLRAGSSYQNIADHVEFVSGTRLDQALIDHARKGLTTWKEIRSLVSDISHLPPESCEDP